MPPPHSRLPSAALPAALGQTEGRQTTAVKQIMAQCVATTSSTKYAQQNSGFALFCFDSTELRNNLLEPWFVEGMRKIKKLNDRKKYAKACCLRSSPEDDNCPFILSNLTFAQFSNYLAKRTSRAGKHQGQVLKMSNASYEQSQSAIKHKASISYE
jgi:hypothetical protein